MTVSGNTLWESLSMETKNEISALAATRQSRCARRIEADMPTNSPELSNDDPTMKIGSDDDTASETVSVHADLTMKQAQVHYDAAMVDEEQPAPAPMLVFR